MNKRYRLLPVVLAFAGLAGACSAETTRADVIEDLTSEPNALTEAQANCVVDGVEAEGIPLGLSEDDATEEQMSTLTDLSIDCILNN